ncbi:hypothetical protein [Neorhizobium vignae]|uniref:hypothetical protein n=1 Tax=Neorhizobium vignae TaxID=690585 RepID=UPI00068F0F2B|nr:hypothetical protein [Neorhizobium vignae]
MSRGGKRDGAGRKLGAPNKATQERQRRVAATGITPLDYMLKVMRNPEASDERRDEMAKAAAPYVHPKLASLQHTGRGGGPIQTVDLARMTEEQLNALESLFGPLATGSGDDEGDQSGEDEESR